MMSGWARKNVQLSRGAMADMDHAELEAAGRLGSRRFRRWANDRILRDLAGKLTADDMQGLFSPVPFGNAPVKSAMQQVAEPDVYVIWESFISIDMDKQSRVLQRWEEHVKANRKHAGSPGIPPPEVLALQAWASISRKPRQALRRAPPRVVEALEDRLLAAVQASPDCEVPLALPTSFHRLLVHGIAEYHGLVSFSRHDVSTNQRMTYVRRQRQLGEHPCELTQIRASSVVFLLSDIQGGRGWKQEGSRPEDAAVALEAEAEGAVGALPGEGLAAPAPAVTGIAMGVEAEEAGGPPSPDSCPGDREWVLVDSDALA